jgi:2-polyprenyl-6-methoxyphenol hydroxylase-like FAD-dependent oxidoreductase
MSNAEVLVVGAGPTGLVLALWLARSGVRVRIIDKLAEPGTTSRALVVHARTLELYRQLGIADEVVALGLQFDVVNLWSYGKRVGRAEFGPIGAGLTPFPHLIIFPQDQHERMLIDHLRRAGVEVERPVELLHLDDHADGVRARIHRADATVEESEFSYVAGCDGARSLVREIIGAGFPGGTYNRMFYVADMTLHGPVADHELHVALDDADFLAVFPLKGDNAGRFIGTVREESERRHDALTWADVSPRVVDRMQIVVERVNWFSTYHVHHRVARHFRRGRVFLLGDAAHIHSPVGGQGMNTGIGDAINLAWKLAAVIRGTRPLLAAKLLDSYEPERIEFAHRLVATTDRAFTFVTRDGRLARFMRRRVVPALLPAILRFNAVRRFMFRTVSQTLIHYRHSALSDGQAGSVRGGDRLPWVRPDDGAGVDNFTPLESLNWQVHAYGDVPADLRAWCDGVSLPVHAFPWREPMRHVGFVRNAAYLVRPDGYVALAGADLANLAQYWQ